MDISPNKLIEHESQFWEKFGEQIVNWGRNCNIKSKNGSTTIRTDKLARTASICNR